MTTSANGSLEQPYGDGAKVEPEQVRSALQSLRTALIVNPLIAIIALFAVWGELPDALLLIWIALIVACDIGRALCLISLSRREGEEGWATRTERALTAGAFLSGCIWAILPGAVDDLSVSRAPLMLLLIVWVTADATMRAGAFAAPAIAFIGPPLIMVAEKLLLRGDMHLKTVAAAVLLYLVFLVLAARNRERAHRTSIRQQHELSASRNGTWLFEAAIEHAPSGVFIATPEMRMIKVNPPLCKMFGCTTEEITAQGLEAYVYPDDVFRMAEARRLILAGASEAQSVEARAVRNGGDLFRFRAVYSVLRDRETEKPILIIGQVEEIDARKETEMKLSGMADPLHLAMNTVGFVIFRIRSKTVTAELDDRLAKICGVERKTAGDSADELLSLVHPDDRERVAAQFTELATAGSHEFLLNHRIIRPSGEIRYVNMRGMPYLESDGAPKSVIGIVVDVTDQMRMTRAFEYEKTELEKALTRSRLAANIAGLGVYLFHCMTNTAEWDDRLYEIFGVDKEAFDCSIEAFLSAVHPDDREHLATVVNDLRHDPREFTLSYRIVRPSGEIRHLRMAQALCHEGNTDSNVMIGVVLDVTDEVGLVQAVKSERIELEAALMRSRLAVNVAGLGVSQLNEQEHMLVLDERLCEIFGVDPSLSRRSPKWWLSMVHPDDQDSLRADLRKAKSQHKPFQTKYRFVRPSGEVRHVRMAIANLYDDVGMPASTIAVNWDVTDDVHQLEALHEAKELAQVTVASAGEGIVRTDAKGKITLCNPVAAAMIGMEAGNVIGQRFAETFKFAAGRPERPIDDPVSQVLYRGEPVRMNSTIRLKVEGRTAHRVNLSVAPMLGADRAVIGSVVVIQDASEIAVLTDRLRKQAYTDELTGLANRRATKEMLDKSVGLAGSGRRRDFLLFIDLDHFKVVNDVCGHGAGDVVLCDVANILRSNMREGDFVGRIGGDEFAVIVKDASSRRVRVTVGRIIDSVAAYRLNHRKGIFQIGASIGIAEIRGDADTSRIMIEADLACHTAKNRGRGCYHMFRASDTEIAEMRNMQGWFHRILHGMENEQFRLFLQKIVSSDGGTVGYEALLRLCEGDTIYEPGKFMEAARRHDLLPQLDRFMFEGVVKILNSKHCHAGALEGRHISVNISAPSVADPAFRSWLEEFFDNNDHIAGYLWIELTETDRMKWTTEEVSFLRAIRARGARLYLDDFGTGYNSFDVLKKVEVDGLKLDHSVTRNLIASPIDQALVSAALTIARRLNIDVVAEGVEDEATFDYLLRSGFKKFQGFLFHRAEDASTLLRAEKQDQEVAG